MPDKNERRVSVPPQFLVRLVWFVHRGVYRLTAGRLGLWRPKGRRWGTLRLVTVGRRTGTERSVIIAYLEDGANVFGLAMNGWGEAEPAWWLNLQAHPEARADLPGERREVRAHRATGEERSRLWAKWRELDQNLDAYAALRGRETAVVVLEPRTENGPHA